MEDLQSRPEFSESAEVEAHEDQSILADTSILEKEAPYDIEDLFFSRTDARGVIQSGNDVFQKVSKFEWSQLIGAPHKVVRHPDMPRSIFYIIWEKLAAGLTVGVYVKNKTRDDRYYWVFAIMTPAADGFLSIRLKPQSELLDVIKDEYAALLELENENNLSLQTTAKQFEDGLKRHGFDNYLAFAATAAHKELDLRDTKLDRPDNLTRISFRKMQQAVTDIRTTSRDVMLACERVENLPTNLQIKSSRLGALAAPIGIIASDCTERTKALVSQMTEIDAATQEAKRAVYVACLKSSVKDMQSEMLDRFADDDDAPPGQDKTEETEILRERVDISNQEMVDGIRELSRKIRLFASTAQSIDRAIVGMNVTRIMCGIESNILGQKAGGIRDIVKNLETFQNDVPLLLRSIEDNVQILRDEVDRLQKQTGTIIL